MKRDLLLPVFVFIVFLSGAAAEERGPKKIIVSGLTKISEAHYSFIQDNALYAERWDELPQAKFWRALMNMSPDSGLLNIGSSRAVIQKVAAKDWAKLTTEEKDFFRDSIRRMYNLPAEENIYFTTGRNHFYNFEAVLPGIDRGIQIFERENTDPFYAQTILLIESPGKNLRSSVGAYGAFQLMPGVARRMGLKVTRYVDERRDFDKSAMGAARLLRTVCIPETNAMLDERGIAYSADDLWYRLLVLHVYHAGAGNVKKAIDVINPCEGGIELIKQLWQTKCGSFGNASQNYSQVAIASLLELEDRIYSGCENISVCPAPGEIIPEEMN